MKKNSTPKISVIMPTYNRCEMLKESLHSILTQTYKDFELIIIDDCSSDETQKYLTEQAKKDSRIIYIRNEKNMHYNYGLRLGCKIARGEYIARMDDDDISVPERFEKQVEFLDKNPDIVVVGGNIEIFGSDNTPVKNWVRSFKPEFLALDAFYKCPICHPTVMMRKSFLEKNNVWYKEKNVYAEDCSLWVDIILAGGKITNLPDVLLKYRVGHTRVSSSDNTRFIQNETARIARYKMWRMFFSKRKSIKLSQYTAYPKLTGTCSGIIEAFLQIAKKNNKKFPQELIYEYLSSFGIKPEQMNICYAGNNAIAEQMCTSMTSIIRTMRNFDTINFIILEDNINKKNKKRIKSLEKENVSVEFIRLDVADFEKRCPKGLSCKHVPVQAYFRYVIPKLKPEYDKILYLDCDVIVRKSLCNLWNTDLGDNYVAAVQEFYFNAENEMKIKVSPVLNSGVMLLNNKKLVEDNITDKLFENTEKFKDKIVYVDQDIYNYTFQGKIIWIDPKYNAQIDLWRPGTCVKSIYNPEQMWYAKNDPVIVHYNSHHKPWIEDGYKELKKYQPFVNCYFNNLRYTPYKYKYIKEKIKNYFYSKTVTEDDIKIKIAFLKFKKHKRLKPSSLNYINSKVWWIDKQVQSLQSKIEYIKTCSWKVEKTQLEKNIPLISEKLDMLGNVPDILYHNKEEIKFIKNFVENYKKYENKHSFLNLIKNLDETSKETIARIIKRIEIVEKSKYEPVDIYTSKEKIQLNNVKKDFWQSILKIDSDVYCYKHYLLPKNNFEIDVFYEKYGLNLVDHSKFYNKDIIDAGAYIGDSSLLLQEYTTKNVYAFEPEHSNYSLLEKTIELNETSRIIPQKLGLGNSKSTHKLYQDELSSSIVPINHTDKFQNIETISIDEFVENNQLEVGLIKLDVEGFESQVLNGAKKTICTQKPTLLISIYHNAYDFFEIKSWIEKLDIGYEFKIFKPTNMAILAGTLLIAEAK